MNNQIVSKSTRNAIGKKYHLTFCPKYKYCETGPYKNDIGEDIPQLFEHRGFIYKLVYYSGCFNPFLEHAGLGLYVKINNVWHGITQKTLDRLESEGVKIQQTIDRRSEAQVIAQS